MSCTKKGYRSVFGDPQRTSLDYIEKLENIFKKKYEVLFPDAVDGQHALSFARKGHFVECYETNEIYINGGIIDGFSCAGLNAKVKYEKLKENVSIIRKNFYEEKVIKKYDFVYAYRTLHLDNNKNVPMQRKIRKLLTAVKENGYIYIFYHLASNEEDYINYPSDQYLRLGEMKKYFDEDNWEIITIIEREKEKPHRSHPFNKKNHTHRVGYIFAHKKNNRLKYRLNYEITIANDIGVLD